MEPSNCLFYVQNFIGCSKLTKRFALFSVLGGKVLSIGDSLSKKFLCVIFLCYIETDRKVLVLKAIWQAMNNPAETSIVLKRKTLKIREV